MTTTTNSSRLHSSQLRHINSSQSSGVLTNPLTFMLLDLLGFVLVFVGLGQHFERINIMPASFNFDHSGLVILIIGLLMTLPFLVWTLKACGSALKSLSR